MKQRRIVAFAILGIVIFLGALSFWKPYLEVYNGSLVVIGVERSGDLGLYRLYPYINYFKRLTPKHMTPSFMTWSPNGETLAFFYSTSIPAWESGIALLNPKNEHIEKVYIFSQNDNSDHSYYINLLTWARDSQSIMFDIYEDGHLLAFNKLDLKTKIVTPIEVPREMQDWVHINSFSISAQEKFVVGNNGYIYIVSQDMAKAELLTKGTDLFLSPNGNILNFFCHREQWSLCRFDLDGNQFVGSPISGNFLGGIGTNANWSQDERYLVYLKVGGESDPHYILMLDTKNGKTYQIYKGVWSDRIIIDQLAWFSKK
jgi:hypothetical protein